MILKSLFFFLLLVGGAYGQTSKTDLNIFYDDVEKNCLNSINKKEFCKAFDFYRSFAYDSCYVYSSKLIPITEDSYEKDVLNYIQGVSADNKKLYKKALENFNEISELSKLRSFKYLKLGTLNLKLKKYDLAIINYFKWEDDKSQVKDISLKKEGYHNLGLCFIHQKDYKQAKKYFDKEFNLIEAKDTLSVIRAKMDLANVYYNQYLDDEAIPLFQEAYDLAKLFSSIEMKQQASKNMAVVEKNRKRYKESVQYYAEHDKLKDSLYNRDKIWELTEKDKQLAIAQKESEIALQDEKLKRQKVQRDGLIIGFVGLLVFVSGLGFFYKKLQSQNRFINKQKEALHIANKTKDYLFSVVSHDLRSPINTIKYQHKELENLIAKKDINAIAQANKKAIEVTESTSHLLNNVLHWSLEQSNQMMFDVKKTSLSPIIQHVLYDYKNIAVANNVRVNEVLENGLVLVDRESLKIVLRNILDNAVKYGGEELTIKTVFTAANKALITIKDNGIGIPAEKLEKINALTHLSIDKIDRSQGIGLGVVLCHTLVKKNNGVLSFASKVNEGTTVTIALPSVEV